ncbi:MAG: N-6 DNA methylase, partial [Chloroflexi bacterium]|nr:N-6 DNA methylase [Chloroflexota bacterium]MYC02123.1 N-6 DNA methylase [Chloroflexota bacterium]
MPTPELCNQFAQYILNRHNQAGVAEADIRAAVRDFLIETGLAEREAIDMEQSPASGWSGRVDLRTRDIIIEFKVRIGDQINPAEQNVTQLDDYLKAAVDGGRPQRFGILTDGKYWILRWPGMGPVRTQPPNAFTLSSAEHGLLLYEWLRDQSQALEERGVAPTDEDVKARLGDGPRFESHIRALTELYEAKRNDPTIALKRDLWRSLLAAALGQVVEEEPDLDRLFVRHTYLSVVVGLAVQAAFGIEIEATANNDPVALLGGQLFVDQTGVSGVVESDFFTWPAEVGGDEWIRDLARRIGWFNWNEAESDIARILYESVIPADDRRRLGEYYTPDWLAREIVDAVVTDPLNQRVLDPACGSGSFIFAAVRKYLAAAQADGRSSAQAVGGLLDHVIGIDVHPVAVHLARATWTLAARDALEGAVADGEAVSATVPVYLGDSLQLRAETSGLFAQQTVTIPVPDPPNSELEFNRELEFPRALVEQADWFDNLMTRMANAIENGEDPAWALDDEQVGEGADREMLEKTAALLQQLHEEGRDHIWAYYTRNVVRPIALRADPVDVIVGNPPWITYHQTRAQVRLSLEDMSKSTYDIWTGGLYAKHQDISSLFFTRCSHLYLRFDGIIGMVLPHSALQTGQFAKWRVGKWRQVQCRLDVLTPWDLERVEPNTFFPIPSCVVFAERVENESRTRGLPRQALRWRGPEGGPFIRQSVALHDTLGVHASPYADRARAGASLFPRSLFFATINKQKGLVQAANTQTVSPRRSKQEKTPWKELELPELSNQPIEAEHVFDAHLGETVAPFLLLDPLKVVLPLSKDTAELEKQDPGWYGVNPQALGTRMRRRWRVINDIHGKHKGPNTDRTLLEQIDYFGQLTAQRLQKSNIRVVYPQAGRPTAAVVTDEEAIIDYRLFWITAKSMAEAEYLIAIINSTAIWEAVIPLTTKNWAGNSRDVEKHLWRLPIPEYDDSNSLHVEIAQAGEDAAAGAKVLWDEIRAEREDKGQSTSVTVARREIRKWLSESSEGQRVEELVGRLLGGQMG